MDEPQLISGVKSQSQNSRSWRHRYNNSWYPEAGALFLSFACVAATAIILAYYDHKPSPKVAGLTLNAVIATFGTASKALLIFAVSNSIGQLKWIWFNGQESRSLLDAQIFDDASRGPLGAFEMLCASTRRSVASLGAIIIILALAFDPFVQLVISYELTTHYKNSDEALINSAGLFLMSNDAYNSTFGINSAIWRDDFVWQASECSTGNCQWNNFRTLALENKCYQDRNWTLPAGCQVILSAEEAYRLNGTGGSDVRNCSVYNSQPSFPDSTRLIEKNLTLTPLLPYSPPGENLQGTLALDMPLVFSAVTHNAYDAWNFYIHDNKTYPTGADVSAPFAMVSTFQLVIESDWTLALQVTTCEMALFLHTYTLNSTRNTINSDLKERQSLRHTFTRNTTDCIDTDNGNFVCLQTVSSSNESWFSDRAQELGSVGTCSEPWDPSNSKQWCLQANEHTLLSDLGDLLRVVEGEYTTSTWYTCEINDTTTDNVWPRWTGSDPSTLTQTNDTSSTSFDVWVDEGSEHILNNIAASITKLGLDPTANSNGNYSGTDPVYGQTGEVVSLVRVKWLWLILPYGLCIAGIMFLLITVHLNRRADTPLWKSSVNALLYHGISRSNRDLEHLSTIGEMDRRAARTKVVLRHCGANEKLVLKTMFKTREISRGDDDEQELWHTHKE